MFNHLFIITTRKNKEDCLFYECLQINKSLQKAKIIFIENNQIGLSKIYNQYLNKFKDKYDFIHFIHDDIFIYDDLNVIDKTLNESNYDIYGVAGGDKVILKNPILWHLICEKKYGVVEHKVNNIHNVISFGNTFDKVVILDGVYLCVKTKNINNWQFNENFDFHHYDIASCIDAFKQHLILGVVPIHIRHEPQFYIPTQNENWIKNNNKFLELYAK